jgi:hypothetical protein
MDDTNNWFSLSIETNGAEEFFNLQSADKIVGTGSFKGVASTTAFTDFTLESGNFVTVFGNKPVLRFWHKYNTETGADAGFIEIQKVDDPTFRWNRISADRAFRNPYTGKVQYGTFAIPYLSGYSGNSNGWIQSYIDLSDYLGEDINIRFRFGTDDNNGPAGGAWFIDEVQIIDMVNFESEATVTSTEGDLAKAGLDQAGVIVNTNCSVVAADEAQKQALAMTLQPNPAQSVLSISLNTALQGNVKVSLISAEGRVALQNMQEDMYEGQIITLDVENIPAGVYMVRLESNAGMSVAKVVIQ